MRILLTAYVIEPGAGSEKGNGWTWAEVLSRRHEVTVLTRPHQREVVEAARAGLPDGHRLTVEYMGPWRRHRSTPGYWKDYSDWHDETLVAARDLASQAPFDAVQHVTWGTVRTASRLHQLDAPLLFGPVGGGEEVPAPFLMPRWVGAKESAKEVQRLLHNRLQRASPGLRAMARDSSVLACTTQQTVDMFPADVHDRAIIVPSSVLQQRDRDLLVSGTPQPPVDGALRCVFVGRLLGWKGPVYAVEAFARFAAQHPGASLNVYGTGPLEGLLRERIAELGVEEQVQLRGRAPRDELLRSLSDHHVFLFPSLHDSSGFVPIEAQTAGLPVVCLDVGGPAELVGDGCGVKVSVTTPEEAVEGLAAGLTSLTDPVAWQAASDAARAHALDPWTTPTIEVLADTVYRAGGLDLGLDLPPRVSDGGQPPG